MQYIVSDRGIKSLIALNKMAITSFKFCCGPSNWPGLIKAIIRWPWPVSKWGCLQFSTWDAMRAWWWYGDVYRHLQKSSPSTLWISGNELRSSGPQQSSPPTEPSCHPGSLIFKGVTFPFPLLWLLLQSLYKHLLCACSLEELGTGTLHGHVQFILISASSQSLACTGLFFEKT